MVKFFQYIKGVARIEIAGEKIERFVNMCSYNQIPIWNIHPREDRYSFNIFAKDVKKLKPILRKTGTRLTIKEKSGLPFLVIAYRHRKLLFAGILSCILLIYAFSLHLWTIDVEGNISRSDEVIEHYLAELNIKPGIRMQSIHCQTIVAKLRTEFPDIVWVSASINGTKLLIQIKENDTAGSIISTDTDQEPCDLVAQKDGVILSMITRAGTPQVKVGDSVQKGQLLVSSYVEIKNDAKEVIGYEYQRADADILAETIIPYHESIETTYKEKEVENKSLTPYLIWNDYRITFLPEKAAKKNSQILTKEYCLISNMEHLTRLIFGMKVKENYKTRTEKHSKMEIQEILSSKFSLFCTDLSKKGVQITANSVKIHIDTASASADGSLTVIEPIAEIHAAERKIVEERLDESNGSNH
ncbi:MAG: sporulation protein YqfD [Hespellia sp.]|nr:sporulation protein YqfD [Hespellia sp.]